jgi:hypothetical protein
MYSILLLATCGVTTGPGARPLDGIVAARKSDGGVTSINTDLSRMLMDTEKMLQNRLLEHESELYREG